MRRILAACALLLVTGYTDAQEKKEAWKESGHSWLRSGRQIRRALGKSIAGEEGLKHEWKAVGTDLGEAGKDTGKAIGKSVEVDPGSSGGSSTAPSAGAPAEHAPAVPSQSGAVD